MKTVKITAIMLISAMCLGFSSLKAQEQTKKWQYTGGIEINFDFLSANKGWKPAAGSRPAGFGEGLGINLGARYGRAFFVFDIELSGTGNFSSNTSTCDFTSGLMGFKIGYDFLKFKEPHSKQGLTFVTGLLFGSNSLKYDFKAITDQTTVMGARNLSANFNQSVMYVPLELRWKLESAYIGLSYMLNVYRGEVTSGVISTSEITDAPNINVLPLRLSFGLQF
ncbi:MAG: hypothetical protein J6M30_08175 [Bacteroidales bacterium]|nr:hypothetical protein [Bacteroidales bacterium]